MGIRDNVHSYVSLLTKKFKNYLHSTSKYYTEGWQLKLVFYHLRWCQIQFFQTNKHVPSHRKGMREREETNPAQNNLAIYPNLMP